jgi:hypothetical protein
MRLAKTKVIILAMADGGAQLLAAAFRRIEVEAEVMPPSERARSKWAHATPLAMNVFPQE